MARETILTSLQQPLPCLKIYGMEGWSSVAMIHFSAFDLIERPLMLGKIEGRRMG